MARENGSGLCTGVSVSWESVAIVRMQKMVIYLFRLDSNNAVLRTIGKK